MAFKYLSDLYNFNPKIIHIDFAKSLHNALETENLFHNKPIIMHCFFHFVQCIVKYMKKYKFSKRAFEILKNIELLCFINPKYITTYSKFLEENLNELKEKQLYQYLYKNWISKKPELDNYYDIFRINNPSNTMPFFFATNNIAESLHSKLKLYLPYKRTSNINFIISMRNIINNSEIKKNDLIRKDYVTKTLISYANNINNKKYKWLEYNRFIELEKEIINKNGITESNAVNNLTDELNALNLEENNVILSQFEVSDYDNNLNNQFDIQSLDESNNSISKKEEKLENDSISSQSEDFDGDYNDIPLFDRIIEDERFINYKDIISDLKIKSGKRSEMINDNEDFIDLPLDRKVKMSYPKKK